MPKQRFPLPCSQFGAARFRPRIYTKSAVRIGNEYLWLPKTLPLINARNASQVVVEDGTMTKECVVFRPEHDKPGLWKMPRIEFPEKETRLSVTIKAIWQADTSPSKRYEEVFRELTFRRQGLQWNYKTSPGGENCYWTESMKTHQITQKGGQAIELDLWTRNRGEAASLLEFDKTQRFYGPGLGKSAPKNEMALIRQSAAGIESINLRWRCEQTNPVGRGLLRFRLHTRKIPDRVSDR